MFFTRWYIDLESTPVLRELKVAAIAEAPAHARPYPERIQVRGVDLRVDTGTGKFSVGREGLIEQVPHWITGSGLTVTRVTVSATVRKSSQTPGEGRYRGTDEFEGIGGGVYTEVKLEKNPPVDITTVAAFGPVTGTTYPLVVRYLDRLLGCLEVPVTPWYGIGPNPGQVPELRSLLAAVFAAHPEIPEDGLAALVRMATILDVPVPVTPQQ